MTLLEQNITEISAQIRMLNEPKQNLESHSKDWLNLFYMLLEFTLQLCEQLWPRKNIHRFEKQIKDCLRWCLGAYKPEKTLFIKYLSHSLKMEINSAIKKEINTVLENGESQSEKISVVALYKDRSIILIRTFEEVYNGRQQRSREYDSKLMTRWLIKALNNLLGNEEIKLALENTSFCDKKMLYDYLSTGEIPKQAEIAAQFNRDKTDASREMRKILKKIK